MWIAIAVVVLDRVVKLLAPGWAGGVVLIPGVFGLTCTYNTGMAFSLLSGRSFLLGLLTLALIPAVWLLLRPYRLGPWSRTGLMLALGGAVGNAADRLFLGAVVDMFEVLAFRFGIFNVADAAVVIGCILIGISLIGCPDEWERRPRP